MEFSTQSIAQNIRAIRMSKQLTQKEAAKGMKVHESLYVRLERGIDRTSIVSIYKAAQFFNVSMDKIVFGQEVQNENASLRFKKQTLIDKIKELEDLEPTDKEMALKLLDLALSKKQLRELNEVIKSV